MLLLLFYVELQVILHPLIKEVWVGSCQALWCHLGMVLCLGWSQMCTGAGCSCPLLPISTGLLHLDATRK